jgi:hypothetical protein
VTTLLDFLVTFTATVAVTAVAYLARQAVTMWRITHENRARSVTNRQALREVIQETDVELDADPLAGLRRNGGNDES